MHDVIIIGAGIAGLMAAQQISPDADFLVLESKNEIGYPLRCGEGIREKVFVEFFKHTSYPFVQNRVKEHVIIVNNLRRPVKENYILVDKPKFEQWLAEPVQKSIRLKHHVATITPTGQYVELSTDKGVFQTKLVIIATGAAFTLQKRLGLCGPEKEVYLGFGGIYKNHAWDKDKFYFIFDEQHSGGFWIFPKDDTLANIGFGGINTNVKEAFYHLLQKYAPQAICVKNYAGLIDCTGPIRKTYSERVIVCGGAAGLVHAASGEGIQYALISGKIAGDCAQNALIKNNFSEQFLSQYELAWKKEIGTELFNSLDLHMLMRLGFKYTVAERLFREPSDDETQLMLSKGILPRRAQLAVKLIRLFGLYDKDLTKKPVSKRLRYAYSIGKMLTR